MKKVNMDLLEKYRVKKGYSMEKISYILGYNARGTYALKITGKRKFTIEDMANLSDLYSCSIDSLMTDKKLELRKERRVKVYAR